MDIEVPHKKSYKFIKDLNLSEERLNNIAIIDGKEKYTYREMFKEWDRYAATFSALGITEKNNSNVLVFCSASKEACFIYYALNMTGAVCSFIEPDIGIFRFDDLKKVVEVEKITDIIILDMCIPDEETKNIERIQKELGIRHIITFHVKIPKFMLPFYARPINIIKKIKVSRIKGIVWLEDMLKKYENTPIEYGSEDDSKICLITHTSGTLKGSRKPIAFTDRNINALAMQFLESEFKVTVKNPKSLNLIPLCTAYGAVDNLHLPLAVGCAIVQLHFAFIMEKIFVKILKIYKPNIVLINSHFWDVVMKSKEAKNIDLSSMVYAGVGGTKVSAENIAKYNKFFKEHNSKACITNGYGLSETGGACIVTSKESALNTIGKPLPGVKIKVYDKETKTYKGIEEAPAQGELFVSSEAAISGEIYENKIFESVYIDGERYIPTTDVVEFKEDGSIIYIGREGRGFQFYDQRNCQPEIIENEIKKIEGIKNCLVVPNYSEELQGNVIKMYIEIEKTVNNPEKSIHDIIYNTFLAEGAVEVYKSIPPVCVVVDKIPLNSMSKEDIHKVITEGIKGKEYSIKLIGQKLNIKDISVKEIKK